MLSKPRLQSGQSYSPPSENMSPPPDQAGSIIQRFSNGPVRTSSGVFHIGSIVYAGSRPSGSDIDDRDIKVVSAPLIKDWDRRQQFMIASGSKIRIREAVLKEEVLGSRFHMFRISTEDGRSGWVKDADVAP